MTAVAARFGYRDASVARVVEQAGVLRSGGFFVERSLGSGRGD
jgi:hypothetical protein